VEQARTQAANGITFLPRKVEDMLRDMEVVVYGGEIRWANHATGQ